jgi:hypothetical protein
MTKTTFSGPIESAAGFTQGGVPITALVLEQIQGQQGSQQSQGGEAGQSPAEPAAAKTEADIASAGGAINIPAGSNLDQALKIILDNIDP